MENLNRVLPGTMGIALGRNPNGAVRDLTEGYRILLAAPTALAGLFVSLAAGSGLALAEAITGWGLVGVVGASLLGWPAVAHVLTRDRRPGATEAPLEWAGFDGPLSDAQLQAVNAALGLGAAGQAHR
jgi:hypothetical protein